MNAALLLMSSTFMAGADAPAHVHPPAAPAVVSGCSTGCAAACDPCASKPSLFDKIKSRLGCHKSKDCCAPAPTCCAKPAPAPKCAPAPTCAPACDSCAAPRPNLFDKIKAKFKHKSDCAPACDTCSSCGAAPGAVVVPAPVPMKETPKPMDPKKVDPKKVGSEGSVPPIAIPTPGATSVPAIPSIPVTPISGSKLSGSTSPY